MASIKIQSSSSGGGSITLTAPTTSSNRTVTFPDEDITLSGGSSTTFGDVGTYVLANRGDDLNTISQGTTYAGSGLYPTGFQSFVYAYGGSAPYRAAGLNSSAIGSGTWRAMGRTPNNGSLSYYYPANLFVRVS